MPARHFSSVDLPEPLRPTMPKNSPRSTAKETSRSARSSSWPARRKGCTARSLSVCTCSRGIRNALETSSTTTAGDATTHRVFALQRRGGAQRGAQAVLDLGGGPWPGAALGPAQPGALALLAQRGVVEDARDRVAERTRLGGGERHGPVDPIGGQHALAGHVD